MSGLPASAERFPLRMSASEQGGYRLERQLWADCVDEVGSSALLAGRDIGAAERGSSSSGRRLRDRDQLGELAEVLGGGGEEELVLGTIRAP